MEAQDPMADKDMSEKNINERIDMKRSVQPSITEKRPKHIKYRSGTFLRTS